MTIKGIELDETSADSHIDSMESWGQGIDQTSGSEEPAQGMPTTDDGRAEPGPESAGGRNLAELRARVAALEAEQARLLAGYAANLESEVARLRSVGPQVIPGYAAEPRSEPLTPPYLGRALVAIDDHMAAMETFAAAGNYDAARQSKLVGQPPIAL